MAYMFPETLPSRASAGEKRLFDILQKLPSDCIVYYEPRVRDRHPDFVVIIPTLGLLVIEVKGWFAGSIRGGDNETVVVDDKGVETRQQHPLKQARDYMFRLMGHCKENLWGRTLLNEGGGYAGKFCFPFGYFALLSNISESQLKQQCGESGLRIFPSEKVLTKDALEGLAGLNSDQLLVQLKAYFDPWWKFPSLDENKVSALRAIIHPEIRISRAAPKPVIPQVPAAPSISQADRALIELKVLDLQQESLARSIGSGHRLVFGVAGSGKTVMLISRARYLAATQPEKKILVLCYNVCLSAYLEQVLTDVPQVTVRHFHGIGSELKIPFVKFESAEKYGSRVVTHLQGVEPTYDALLIDEAQDFAGTWFLAALRLLSDPANAELLIVGDSNQGIFKQSRIVWSKLGINAKGRTSYLRTSYRSSKEIVTVAAEFASQAASIDEDGMTVVAVDPKEAIRSTRILPVFAQLSKRTQEGRFVYRAIDGLLKGHWFGQRLPEKLEPQQIGVLYSKLENDDQERLTNLINGLSRLAPVTWLSDPKKKERRREVQAPSIKVQTIHSSKGLQYRAVFILWADLLPNAKGDIEHDQKTMYVGLTRAEDYLAVSASAPSDFVTRLKNCTSTEKRDANGELTE